MMLAVALWSFASAMHTVIADHEARILVAKFQCLAVAPIGVLWLLFASDYSRIAWPLSSERLLRLAVWIVPALTFVLVATNEQHQLHWAAIEEIQTSVGTRLVYTAGPWYWVHVGYSYVLVLIGTLLLARGLRRFPPPYRRQTALIIAGAIVPWIGNLVYLGRV